MHVIAIFAVYCSDDGKVTEDMLCCSPPLEEDELNTGAESHEHLMEWILERLNLRMENVVCLICDNCETNKRISRITGIPMIGCASHRLNLAVKRFLQPHEELIKRINELMSYFKRHHNLNLLKKYTDKQPIKLHEIRWSGTLHMIQRFLDFKPALQDEELKFDFKYKTKKMVTTINPTTGIETTVEKNITMSNPLPTDEEWVQIEAIHTNLSQIDEPTKLLQTSDTMPELRANIKNLGFDRVDLGLVRLLFDTLIEEYEEMAHYLSPNASIVENKHFENAIVKLQRGESHYLTVAEGAALGEKFRRGLNNNTANNNSTNNLANNEDHPKCKILNAAFKKRATENQTSPLYINVDFIIPTSNVIERFFSRTKRVFSDLRRSMQPYRLEGVLYLLYHKDLWNELFTIEELISDFNNAARKALREKQLAERIEQIRNESTTDDNNYNMTNDGDIEEEEDDG
jgi:hypothetical protein